MKILVIYDSCFGCTQKIAQAIFDAVKDTNDASISRVTEVKPDGVKGIDYLIVGSPTRGFRPTKPVTDFLDSMASNGLKNIKVAAFDTRIELSTIKSTAFRFIVKAGGYAAKPILSKMKSKGGLPAAQPEGFYVTGEEGPLQEGEVERAVKWITSIVLT